MTAARLRPIERRIVRMAAAGLTPVETGQKFKRSARYVEQVLRLARVPRLDADEPSDEMSLRPLERRLLQWRVDGADPREVGAMFARTPDHIKRVLKLIDYKQQRSVSS